MSPLVCVENRALHDPMYVQLPMPMQHPSSQQDDFAVSFSFPPGLLPNLKAHHISALAKISLPPGLDVDVIGATSKLTMDSIAAEPLIREANIKKVDARPKTKRAIGSRWWTNSNKPLMCPLTNFPINLLPYPPFKLRTDPLKPSLHKLVDGKFLALQVIATGSFMTLPIADVKALDDYCHRCKLGPYRPGKALALWKEVRADGGGDPDPVPSTRAQQAKQELANYVASAREELSKLRRIQENRVLRMQEQQIYCLTDFLEVELWRSRYQSQGRLAQRKSLSNVSWSFFDAPVQSQIGRQRRTSVFRFANRANILISTALITVTMGDAKALVELGVAPAAPLASDAKYCGRKSYSELTNPVFWLTTSACIRNKLRNAHGSRSAMLCRHRLNYWDGPTVSLLLVKFMICTIALHPCEGSVFHGEGAGPGFSVSSAGLSFRLGH